jgi:hypothetical protein
VKIYLQAQPVSKKVRGWRRAIRLLAAWSSPTLIVKVGAHVRPQAAFQAADRHDAVEALKLSRRSIQLV